MITFNSLWELDGVRTEQQLASGILLFPSFNSLWELDGVRTSADGDYED